MTASPSDPAEVALRLAVLADVHSGAPGPPEGRWHRDFRSHDVEHRVGDEVRRLVRDGCDALCLLGDLVHDGTRGQHREIVRLAAAAADCPVFVVRGNHDPIGEPAVAGHGVAAIALRRADGRWWGVAPGAEAQVVLGHFPLRTRRAAFATRGLRYPSDLANARALLAKLSRDGAPRIVLHGHLHAEDAVVSGPVLQLGHGALIEEDHPGRLVEVTRALTVRWWSPGGRASVWCWRNGAWRQCR